MTTGEFGADVIDVTRVVPLAKQAGFVNLILDVIKQLRSLLLPYMDKLLNVTLRITNDATSILASSRDEIDQRYEAFASHRMLVYAMLLLCHAVEANTCLKEKPCADFADFPSQTHCGAAQTAVERHQGADPLLQHIPDL